MSYALNLADARASNLNMHDNASAMVALRAGTSRLSLYSEALDTPIGTIVLVTDAAGAVRALDWSDYRPRLNRLLRLHYGSQLEFDTSSADDGGDQTGEIVLRSRSAASPASVAVARYFSGDLDAINALAVATGGTPFQRAVWSALRRIPTGNTTSYSELASVIGHPRAVRAVGHANGSNPIGIIVPCHRVVGASGQLTGYAGGLERKRWLLAHEAAHAR